MARLSDLRFSPWPKEECKLLNEPVILRDRLIEATRLIIRQKWHILVGRVISQRLRNLVGHVEIVDSRSQSIKTCHNTCGCSCRDELLLLRAKLTNSEIQTDILKQSATNEISRLGSLLAAESGEHAASVCNLEHRVSLQLEQIQSQAEVSMAHLKEKLRLLEMSLDKLERSCAQHNAQEANNRVLLISLLDRLKLACTEKNSAFDKLEKINSLTSELVSKLSALPSRNTFEEDRWDYRIKSNYVRILRLEQRSSVVNQMLKNTLNFIRTEFQGVGPSPVLLSNQLSSVDPTVPIGGPRLAAIDSCSPSPVLVLAPDEQPGSSRELPESTHGRVRGRVTESCVAVEPEIVCFNSPACGTELMVSTTNSDFDLGKLSELFHGKPKPVPMKAEIQRVPRFPRYQMRSTNVQLRSLSPFTLHQPQMTIDNHFSRAVSVNEPEGISVATTGPVDSLYTVTLKRKHRKYERSSTIPCNDRSLTQRTGVGRVPRPDQLHVVKMLSASQNRTSVLGQALKTMWRTKHGHQTSHAGNVLMKPSSFS